MTDRNIYCINTVKSIIRVQISNLLYCKYSKSHQQLCFTWICPVRPISCMYTSINYCAVLPHTRAVIQTVIRLIPNATDKEVAAATGTKK
jgi:hypothetical protein